MKRPRVTVRRLMILVLVVGGGLGWLAHAIREARIQREAVEAVRQAGGVVLYDWQMDGHNVRFGLYGNMILRDPPGWPKWLVDRLGVDFFGHVQQVSVGRSLGPNSTEEPDAVVSRIAQLRRLKNLSLFNFDVSDEGLASLRGMSRLESLKLRGCVQVTDRGMAHVATLTNLKQLFLEQTQVGDEGLSRLRGLTGLEVLNLGHTRITNSGLAHLEGLKNLETLGLDGVPVGGPPMVAILKGRSRIQGLYLNDTNVTDPDLASLEGMDQLGWLGLRNDAITDAGLSSLKRLKSLESLDLSGTKVSRAGVADLQASLKSARIESDAR